MKITYVFSKLILADPTNEEEMLCTGILTITESGAGLCSVHKPGGSPLSDEQIEDCMNSTKKRATLIYKCLNIALEGKKQNI